MGKRRAQQRTAPLGQQAHRKGSQPQRGGGEPAYDTRSREAERLSHAFVEEAGYGCAHERTRGRCKPTRENVARRLPDRPPHFGACETGGLVVAVELLECRQVLGDVANMHALADLAPEGKPAPSFLVRQRSPAEAIEPAQRLECEGR